MLKDDPGRAAQIAKTLNDSAEHLSHGAVIDAEKATELGLVVEYLDPGDDLWQAYWRLYCEMRITWPSPAHRLFEGRQVSLLLG